VAAVSLAVITPLVGASAVGTSKAVPVTAALAIVTGIVYLLLRVARMGWISNFLSRAVMSGFVLGFSIGIIIDQTYKLLGVVLSLLLLIAHSSRPQLHRMGRDPASDTYLDVERNEGLIVEPSVLVVRLDGPLFFANANRFNDGVMLLISDSEVPVGAVVVDGEAVSLTDTDGADVLISMARQMKASGRWFAIARVESAIEDQWRRAGAIDEIGADRVFASVREAADAATRGIAARADPPERP
jgi:SulP family sulfate permease